MTTITLDPTQLMRHGYRRRNLQGGDKDYVALVTARGQARIARHVPFGKASDAQGYAKRWLNKYSSMLDVFNPHVFETKEEEVSDE